jgi:hypothetical protein
LSIRFAAVEKSLFKEIAAFFNSLTLSGENFCFATWVNS